MRQARVRSALSTSLGTPVAHSVRKECCHLMLMAISSLWRRCCAQWRKLWIADHAAHRPDVA